LLLIEEREKREKEDNLEVEINKPKDREKLRDDNLRKKKTSRTNEDKKIWLLVFFF
jgi:hypothetical protein